MKEFLLDYIRYNFWANQRITKYIIDHCSAEQTDQEVASSFPSLKKTLLHIYGAEAIWLQRLIGDSPTVWKGSSFSGGMVELVEEISSVDREFIDFAQSCGEAFLLSPFKYNNLEGKEFTNTRAEAILHCVNHSSYHRGQLISMLRQLGFTQLFSTDYISYCRER
jgi:uncharacterized damage-inducible protein DinB